jgi:hypothetical protein
MNGEMAACRVVPAGRTLVEPEADLKPLSSSFHAIAGPPDTGCSRVTDVLRASAAADSTKDESR